MQSHWVRKQDNTSLIIFVLGWAADHRVVEHIAPEGYDVACLYDYRDFTPGTVSDPAFPLNLGSVAAVLDEISGVSYADRYLFAWSFGVWAAERIFGNSGIAFTGIAAFNGTPFPVNERFGIEPRRMAITLRGLKEGGMDVFNRRAYGSTYEKYSAVLSPRTTEENAAELETLVESSVLEYMPSLSWSEAVVGGGDLIFPPENMLRYWGPRAKSLPLPHYPFDDGRIIEKYLGNR